MESVASQSVTYDHDVNEQIPRRIGSTRRSTIDPNLHGQIEAWTTTECGTVQHERHGWTSRSLFPTTMGAHPTTMEHPIETTTTTSKTRFMLGVFAEFEDGIRRKPQADEIKAAKRKGAYRGPPTKIDASPIQTKLRLGTYNWNCTEHRRALQYSLRFNVVNVIECRRLR